MKRFKTITKYIVGMAAAAAISAVIYRTGSVGVSIVAGAFGAYVATFHLIYNLENEEV